jgi:manganese/zinc/iron transport system permease protein
MMALMTGAFLLAAFLFGPRYGVIAGLRRRARQALENEARALVVHLMTHERGDARHEENVAEALRTHLGWTRSRSRAVLGRSLAQGLVLRRGNALRLTDKGRIEAEALLEPWRRGG